MNYPKEVQAIFDLTLRLLEQDEQFDRNLLADLGQLCTKGHWERESAISAVIEQLVTTEELIDG